MSKAKKLLVVAGAAVVGVLLLVFGFKEYSTSKKLQKEGKQTVGVVTDADERRGRKGRRSYYLTVLYKTEAQSTFEQNKRVSRSVYSDAAKAGSVQVTYLPSDPNVCEFGPKVGTQFGMLLFGLVALAFSGFTAFGKGADDSSDSGPTSEADAEKELLADSSKYDDQQKAA